MKKLQKVKGLVTLVLMILIAYNSSYAQKNKAKSSNFELASEDYVALADKTIKHIEKFEFSEHYKMLSDDIELYMPDGDAGTRTSFIGKKAVMDFWNSYQEKSGNDKIISKDLVHVALNVKEPLNYTKITGTIVISYFSLEMFYGAEKTNIRMNWAFHFNQEKQIDKIYTYYDRTPIIAAAKRNLLSKK